MTQRSTSKLTVLASIVATAVVATAQVTYVDAVAGGNTTLANGAAFVPNPATSGSDNNWSQRAFANGGTAFEASAPIVLPGEDAPMLRTRITGLVPGRYYSVYGYFWCDTGRWRGRGLVATSQPAPQLPGYNGRHFTGSVFDPMTPLALGTTAFGPQQVSRDIPTDAAGFSTSAYFTTPVLIKEGNRWLQEAPFGHYPADASGEITVYIDDLQLATTTSDRTWYDGVGYTSAVPDRSGTGCGTPTVPTIAFTGSTLPGGGAVSVDLAGAPGTVPCSLVFGFSNTVWQAIPLPFDLGIIGFPGCELHISHDIAVNTTTDASGAASVGFTNNGFFGVPIYFEWLALDILSATPLSTTRAMVVTWQ